MDGHLGAIFYRAPNDGNAVNRWRLNPICPLCNEETKEPATIRCGHTFCWSCYSEYRDTKGKFGYNCPSCIYQDKANEALQLVSIDESGLLHLHKSALHRCFLHRQIEEYPVYLISVVGEWRTGKSFLMNYIVKALQSQETTNEFDLGAEDEILKGFPWKPGADKVTCGIWIWSKPFILEKNGQKIAVFLLDTEGSMDIEGDKKSNIKMCRLTLLLSSHLVYNVNSTIKESDIDYLEIYCDEIDCKERKSLKKMKKRYKDCTFLEVLEHCSHKCYLMPQPGNKIPRSEEGRLKDMDEEFLDSLKTYLLSVVERVQLSIGSAVGGNTLTCSEMFQMVQVYLSYINDLKCKISNPSELYNMKKNLENMQERKDEFQDFLNNWPFWKFRIGDEVANKIQELQEKFQESFRYISKEDRSEQLEKLKVYLVTEGDKFCKRHNIKLLINGIPALLTLGMAAAPAAGVFLAAEAVAAPSTGATLLAGAAAIGRAAFGRWF
ncbi:RING finger protein 112-like isoform 2-T2 [Leptodactylus fuscus]|uniref:RING finger protein 112-like isoform X2 n=1 Tax=Leptodactylus fuscus TaxID=238119 RepID=UPI003F4E9A18